MKEKATKHITTGDSPNDQENKLLFVFTLKSERKTASMTSTSDGLDCQNNFICSC